MYDKRICLVTDTLCDANGVSRFIQDIATCAQNMQRDFLAICATKKPYCKKLPNIKIIKPRLAFRMPYYPQLDLVIPPLLKLYHEIKRFDPDIIHIATPGLTGWMALFIAKKLKIPITGTYHTDFPAYMLSNTKSHFVANKTRWFMKQFYRPFSGIFIRSQLYKNIVKEELGFEDNTIFAIPPGIDTAKFDKKFKNKTYWHQHKIPKHAKILLYVGRISIEKNIPFLIDLFSDIQNDPSFESKDIHLVLVGSGRLTREIEKRNIPNLHLLGHKSGFELSTIYASSDIFIFPSTTDTLGQVVIEAMASGLAVITSDQGGPKTIIGQNGCVGYALNISESIIWKMYLHKLLFDKKELIKIQKCAYNKAKNMRIEDSFAFFWNKSVTLLQHKDNHG